MRRAEGEYVSNLNRRPYAKTYTSSGTLIFDTYTQFKANGNSTTNLVSYYQTGNESDGYRVFTYTYDAYGNISQINEGSDSSQSVRHKYTYDSQSQLIMDIDYDMNCTRVYVYDTYGNIRSKAELSGTGYTSYSSACAAMTSSNTDTYTYGDSKWLDLLTAYNGNAITYDGSGNPLTYYNGMSFTWSNGRQLSTLTTSAGKQISYEYNMEGIRTAKTVNGVTTEYIVNGGMILQEICGSTVYNYYYDENGAPVAMKKGSTTYYFEKNAQGDIVALFNASGAEVARITYDAYGNIVYFDNPSNLYIPFRYRGYYFDSDTGFYYLQSRYYDSETGRFLNADGTGYLLQNPFLNLITYCGNNPIMYVDPSGYYINNQGPKFWFEGQRQCDITYGNSNIAETGCAPIAVYNLLYPLENDVSLQTICDTFELMGAIKKEGGTDRKKFGDYLCYLFSTVQVYWGDTSTWGKRTKGKVHGILISYSIGDNGHVMAGVSQYFNNKESLNYFYFYNSDFAQLPSYFTKSIPQALEIIKDNGGVPQQLVVVNGYMKNQYAAYQYYSGWNGFWYRIFN